jgi:hypothetical protein
MHEPREHVFDVTRGRCIPRDGFYSGIYIHIWFLFLDVLLISALTSIILFAEILCSMFHDPLGEIKDAARTWSREDALFHFSHLLTSSFSPLQELNHLYT